MMPRGKDKEKGDWLEFLRPNRLVDSEQMPIVESVLGQVVGSKLFEALEIEMGVRTDDLRAVVSQVVEVMKTKDVQLVKCGVVSASRLVVNGVDVERVIVRPKKMESLGAVEGDKWGERILVFEHSDDDLGGWVRVKLYKNLDTAIPGCEKADLEVVEMRGNEEKGIERGKIVIVRNPEGEDGRAQTTMHNDKLEQRNQSGWGSMGEVSGDGQLRQMIFRIPGEDGGVLH